MRKDILLRSFMFLPAYKEHFIDKALESDADALILDMEDSVPPELRQNARNIIIRYCKEGRFWGKKIFVRVNEIGTKDFAEDIGQLTVAGITGIMPSKIKSQKDIIFLDYLLDMYELQRGFDKGSILLAPLIETTQAVAGIEDIIQASERIVAVCFGGEDYLNDLGCIYTYQTSAFMYPRAKIVNAARAAGILPIDTPYLDISDLKGLEQQANESYRNGFAGNLILNPKQIAIVNRAFLPKENDIAYAREVIEAVREANQGEQNGVAMMGGRMIGPPMRKRAEMVVKQIEQLKD